MRCRQARKMLALHAGGDLPERQARELEAHLEGCADCAGELRDIKNALAAVGEIAAADQPGPLPADFAQQVRQAARRRQAQPERSSL